MANDVLIETTVATVEPKNIVFPAVAETIAAAAAKYKALSIAGINDRKGLAAEEQARLDALKPVCEKLIRYSDLIAAVEIPDVDADLKERIVEARMAFSLVVEGLAN